MLIWLGKASSSTRKLGVWGSSNKCHRKFSIGTSQAEPLSNLCLSKLSSAMLTAEITQPKFQFQYSMTLMAMEHRLQQATSDRCPHYPPWIHAWSYTAMQSKKNPASSMTHHFGLVIFNPLSSLVALATSREGTAWSHPQMLDLKISSQSQRILCAHAWAMHLCRFTALLRCCMWLLPTKHATISTKHMNMPSWSHLKDHICIYATQPMRDRQPKQIHLLSMHFRACSSMDSIYVYIYIRICSIYYVYMYIYIYVFENNYII